jgi:hypothetical protein
MPCDERSESATPRSARTLPRAALAILFALVPVTAAADSRDDGYCDYVEGSAAAVAAPLFAPEVYGMFGQIEQPSFAVSPVTEPSNLRGIGGVRWSLTNVFAGRAVNARASADCQRHKALVALRGAPQARALAARIRVYDEAQAEANRILVQVGADLEARRVTLAEAMATRMRVEELRTVAARTRGELARLPAQDERPLPSLVAAYRVADGDIEKNEAKLRRAATYDVSVRFGFDSSLALDGVNTEFVAVVQFGVNLSALWIDSHNARAARGRSRYVRTGADSLGPEASVAELRATLEPEEKRAAQVSALIADLGRQLDALAKLEGEQNKRFRETIWFDWVEAKAELAYLQAHIEATRPLLDAYAR